MSKDLRVKDYFTPVEPRSAVPAAIPAPGITPAVFTWKGREVLVTAARNGRVYLLDTKSLGGPDHHTPLARTEPLASPDLKYAGNGFNGAFASWEDTDKNVRWIYAPVWGPALKGNAPHGSIVALRIDEHDGDPVVTPVWTSLDMATPAAPVTANGLVFTLSTGESNREAKENGRAYSVAEREKMAAAAVLYVLDAATGAELYSSGTWPRLSRTTEGSRWPTGASISQRTTTRSSPSGFLADQPQLRENRKDPMQKTKYALSLAALACGIAYGADWLTDGGNPQRTAWQRDEHILTKDNVEKSADPLETQAR